MWREGQRRFDNTIFKSCYQVCFPLEPEDLPCSEAKCGDWNKYCSILDNEEGKGLVERCTEHYQAWAMLLVNSNWYRWIVNDRLEVRVISGVVYISPL